MAETVKVPGIGPVKKTYVYAGVGIAGGIVIYAYWRASQQPAAEELGEEAADAGEEISTDLGVPEYDYVSEGGIGYGGVAAPIYQYPNTTGTVTSTLPTTNAEWARAALEQLQNEGVDSNAASSAIGNFIARLCVSAAQADLVRRANAMIGAPPQGTFNVITCPGAPPPGSGGGDTPKGPTGPFPKIGVSAGRTSVTLDWPHVAHADGYTVYRNGARIVSVKYSKATLSGLRPNTSYSIRIQPIPVSGYTAGPAGSVTVRTKR